MRFWIGLGLAVMIATAAAAKETTPKPMDAALAKFVTEALYCTAYFGFAQEAVRRRPDAGAPRTQTLYNRLGDLADQSLNLAVTTGRRIKLTQDGLAEQQKAVFNDVKKITQNSMTNLPVLVAKYDKPCKALTASPADRVKELFGNEFK